MQLGLLFDLDGTMADTDTVHFEAFNILLGEFGRSITVEAYKSTVMGGANAQIMQALFPELDTQRHIELAHRKEQLFRSRSARMQPIAGLLELLAEAEHHRIPVGVVTNAPRANARHMLQALGLPHLLPTVVIGEEIARAKPDPLPYLTGAERLVPSPDHVIAFEDSAAGVTSASAAGFYTVGLTTSLDPAALAANGADMTIDDYRDPALLTLLRDGIAGKAPRRLRGR